MLKHRLQQLAAFTVALGAGPALAHHSIKMIDTASPVWLKATVVSYEPRNPHVLIHVEGNVTIEGPIMRRLEEMKLAKDFIKAGDIIEICGFPFKQDVIASNAAMPVGTPKLPALHAQLLVLPNGRWQPWGPYGKLDNCVRPNDTPKQWADFINAVPMGHEYWCKGLALATVPSVAPKAFVQEVNEHISAPCG